MKDIKFEEEKKDEVKPFPVRMKRGYVPIDPAWEKDPMLGTNKKILMGEEVSLPIDEARRLVKLGVAERADEIEI